MLVCIPASMLASSLICGCMNWRQAFTTPLAFFDSYRSAVLPANLLQAQRDYFEAHTYERVDKPRGEYFHTNWTGQGGTIASSTYNVGPFTDRPRASGWG